MFLSFYKGKVICQLLHLPWHGCVLFKYDKKKHSLSIAEKYGIKQENHGLQRSPAIIISFTDMKKYIVTCILFYEW